MTAAPGPLIIPGPRLAVLHHGPGRDLPAEYQIAGWAAAPLPEQPCDRPPDLAAELARLARAGLVERAGRVERPPATRDRVGREARVTLDLRAVAR